MGVADGNAVSETDLRNVPYILKLIDTDMVGGSTGATTTLVTIAGGTVNAGAATTGIIINASLFADLDFNDAATVTLKIGSIGGAGTTRLTQRMKGADSGAFPTPQWGQSMIWYETAQDWAGTVIVNITAQDSTATDDTGCYSMVIIGY